MHAHVAAREEYHWHFSKSPLVCDQSTARKERLLLKGCPVSLFNTASTLSRGDSCTCLAILQAMVSQALLVQPPNSFVSKLRTHHYNTLYPMLSFPFFKNHKASNLQPPLAIGLCRSKPVSANCLITLIISTYPRDTQNGRERTYFCRDLSSQ